MTYNITLVEINGTLAILGSPLQAIKGAAYSFSFGYSGNVGAVTWSQSGALPAGLSFSAGTISGTPTVVGSFPITVTITDLVRSTTGSYVLKVVSLVLAVTGTPPDGLVGVPYSFTFSVSGAAGPVTMTVTSGSLPAGLSLSGVSILGTPTTASSYSFNLTFADGVSSPVVVPCTIVIATPTYYIILENGNRLLFENNNLALLENAP